MTPTLGNIFLEKRSGVRVKPDMPRLINRQMQIPGGFKFYQPQTKWEPPRFASFDTIVGSLISHRQGNPELVRKYGLATDKASVEREVDTFNALICKQMGWTDYFVDDGGGGDPLPKLSPHNQQAPSPGSGRLVVGAKTIINWIKSGAEAVPPVQANMRAMDCINCPKHGKGGWLEYFTVPAQAAIQEALNQRREWKLSTPLDPQLKVCQVCWCPMPLKVHMPIEAIAKELAPETKAELPDNCWIKKELTPK